jgi:hypothetical protein
LSEPHTDTEIADALAEMRVMLEVLVAHLDVHEEVDAALAQRRAKAARSRFEIERALGQAVEPPHGEDVAP